MKLSAINMSHHSIVYMLVVNKTQALGKSLGGENR